MTVSSSLDAHFLITSRSSTIPTEIRAGVSSFLTMSYVLLVNPQILSLAGIPSGDVVVGTCVSSAVGCLVCGIFGNLPFGLAPGMGLSAYITYGLVLSNSLSSRQALTACLVAGVLQGVFAVTGVSRGVMFVVPQAVKHAIVVGMGILVAMIGMVSVNLIVADSKTIVGLGDLTEFNIQLSLSGLILIGTLVHHDVKGSILIGVTLLTVVCWYRDGTFPETFVEWPSMDLPAGGLVDVGSVLDGVSGG